MTTWYRGETMDGTLTVTVGGARRSLAPATGIELRLKKGPGYDDPPLATLTLGAGIELEAQSGATLGQAAVTFPADWLDDVPAGTYYVDVRVLFAGGVVRYVIKPYKQDVRDVV